MYSPPAAQPLTRSLLSGSDASFPGASESAGGSCGPSRYSKPYVLCSATDAASAAIDFSKGSVDDGVVDSPPSRGSAKTPVCSPSPLKRSTSTPVRDRSHSPTPRTESTPQRKLYGDCGDDAVIPRVEDGGASPVRSSAPGEAHPAPKSDTRARNSSSLTAVV